MVSIETSMGTIEVELHEEQAPVSVANFLAYVDKGFFDGTIFHRVIPNFMIQCGGFTEDMQQKKTEAPIANEAENGLSNERGTLAMARTNDINSATSQFFINLRDNAFLDHSDRDFGYAVFGRVTAGIDVVDQIAAVATGRKGMHDDVPTEAVTIIKASRTD